MSNFKNYLTESEQQYKLRLKTVVPLDDAAMDRIEQLVARYRPVAISRPVKTMLQSHPLDFQNIENAEVWIVDFTFSLPAAQHILRADIRKALNAPEIYVLVRYENEPSETYTAQIAAGADLDAEAAQRGLSRAALLNTGRDYPEYVATPGSEQFGDEYNRALLAYLRQVETERPERRVATASPLFHWLKPPDTQPTQDRRNYRDLATGKPAVLPILRIMPAPVAPPDPGPRPTAATPPVAQQVTGSVHDRTHKVRRLYQDQAGHVTPLQA